MLVEPVGKAIGFWKAFELEKSVVFQIPRLKVVGEISVHFTFGYCRSPPGTLPIFIGVPAAVTTVPISRTSSSPSQFPPK